jgi:hypothetical protein
MGTQGLSGHAVSGGRGDVRATSRPITILAVSLAILPLAAGCSGSSLPSFGSSGQQATVPPPPSGSVAATGQPAYAPPPGQPATQPGAYAAAPPAQPAADGTTVGSFTTSYVNFIKAFRDPDPDSQTPGSAARPPAYAQQPAAAPQQNAYVPHPPSTYVPAGQPYIPPQGQAANVPPPPAQQNYAPPPAQQNPPRSGQQRSATSSTKQTKQAKPARASSQQNAAVPPVQPAAPAPAAAPAAKQDYSDSLPYPKQSLTDVFRGSTETQTVPRPPSTYTPSGQPYTPGQAANGAAGGAAPPPASQNPSDSLPYPKQSLFEVFSNDK